MRAPPRRGLTVCIAAIVVTILAAAPIGQSREDRTAFATKASIAVFEPWFGTPPSSSPVIQGPSAWPPAPAIMDIESRVADAIARSYWKQQPPTTLMAGASRYLQSRAVARMFDLSFGRAGSGVDSVHLFGGTWTMPFTQLRFDGAAANLRAGDLTTPVARAALAFASLERIIGAPRLIGALQSAIAASPQSDAELVRVLEESLGQDVSWLLDAGLPASMNYRIARLAVAGCSPSPCQRVEVEVAHDGDHAFKDLDVRVDFPDGQSASTAWNGEGPSRTFVFEGPAAPIGIRVDPELRNLLDDNLLDQSREPGARTNAPISKWIGRWAVWLQDAMLAYSALV